MQGRSCSTENEISFLEKRMKEDRKTVEELRRKEENDKAAQQMHDLYQSLVDKGFSEEQAFYLFVEMVKTAWEK